MESFLLDVKNIQKTFRISRKIQKSVLNGVDFVLNSQEILTIMGPSGGGKSTFLKILAGILSYDAGTIFFKGVSTSQHKEYYLSNISFIFQDYKLIPHLNVFENVVLALRLRGVEDWHCRANEALDFCLISHLAKAYPWQLSGGESQRVGIARAISVKPSIIFADEPTGNLDAKTAKEVLDVFGKIKDEFKTSFIIVTHDPRMVEYSDRQYFLSQGKLSLEESYVRG